ncbi:Uncharacterised protein r2_g457 [Pycnogonum litorale]
MLEMFSTIEDQKLSPSVSNAECTLTSWPEVREDGNNSDKEFLEIQPADESPSLTRSNSKSLGRPVIRLFTEDSQYKVDNREATALKEYGFIPNRLPTIEDGSLLPSRLKPFPKEYYGKPIEEIDHFIYEKTFCLVTKRFSKSYINRYSASRSFFLFRPYNKVRKLALKVASNQCVRYFDYLVMFTILVNCVFLTLTNPVEEAEYIFLSIYTLEMVIKAVAKGFILNKYTYLRNVWNWLDFTVIMSGYLTICMEMLGVEIGNIAGLRTFRVLRALKTVSIMPGLKTIVNALLRSISMLAEVMALTIFCLMVFALFALQVYMGVLRNKCIENIPLLNDSSSISDDVFNSFVQNESRWLMKDGNPVLCGNITGSRRCPENYTCLPDFGSNPNYGYSNFDNFGWSMLATLQLITLDYFEDLYNKVIACTGPLSLTFFIFVVFLGSYYLVNLMLAVVAISYEEEAQVSEMEHENSLMQFQSKSSLTNDTKQSSQEKFMGIFKRNERRKNIRRYVMKYRRNSATKSGNTSRRQSHSSSKHSGLMEQDNVGTITSEKQADIPDHKPTATVQDVTIKNSDLSHEDTTNNLCLVSNDCSEIGCAASEREISCSAVGVQTDEQCVDQRLEHCSDVSSSDVQEDSGVVDDQDDDVSTNGLQTRVTSDGQVTIKTKRPTEIAYGCKGCAKYGVTVSIQYWWTFCNTNLLILVNNPMFDYFITVCIVINTVFLAVEHHDMSPATAHTLDVGNKVFTSVFSLEAFIKLLSLKKEYFKSGWNIFDLLVVIASLLDLALQSANKLSVFRTLRLLRVFKLAQSWVTMRILLTIIMNTMGALGNLTLVLAITMYIFAVLGMQLFGSAYTEENFYPDPVPRWNFTDFCHSIMMIFRILCGEWIEPMWECMRVIDGPQEMCMAVFLPTLVFGEFLVLNLFLALLLNSFNSEELKNAKDDAAEMTLTQKLNIIKLKVFNRTSSAVSESKSVDIFTTGNDKRTNVESVSGAKVNNDTIELQRLMPSTSTIRAIQNKDEDLPESKISNTHGSCLNQNQSLRPSTLINQTDLRNIKVKDFRAKKKKEHKNPENCFPSCCCDSYDNNDSKWTMMFYEMRKKVVSVVDHTYFEYGILILIFLSSVSLCFEDIYLDERPHLKRALSVLNTLFAILFTIEMLMKWVAHGFVVYFTSFWSILDFVIVTVSLMSIVLESTNNSLSTLRSLRTLRALRPLRAISRWQGMKIVVNALMYAIPSIINVLLVCIVFWLIFSIMGVQFFGGKFFKCVDDIGERIPANEVENKTECLQKNYSWVNSKINFDNVGNGYLALFQVATFEGWMEIMIDAVDARDINEQPERESNLAAYVYFVVFIICGSFFTLNLFIGVIIDNFNMLKKRYEGGVLDIFLTDSQKNYYAAMKKLGRKKPQKIIHRPSNKYHAMIYDVVMSNKFELVIFILILTNMVIMATEHYDQPPETTYTLEVFNIIFTSLFTVEATLKMIGLRWSYFTVPWNVFDFVLVVSSILGIVLQDVLVNVLISPTLLRVVRVFRIGRILRLIKAASGIRKLLFALMISIPALINIGMLLFLIMFIYALIGMGLFGHVKRHGIIDDQVNFETFGRSMVLLFRLTTSAGWNDVLDALMKDPPGCDPNNGRSSTGNCGQPMMAVVYFVSYIFINFLIIINMYIAVILENFNQAHQEEEIGIVEDDLEMFYVRWARYDPHATQFINFSQLSDFVSSLDSPLGITKPNSIALVALDVPISEGDRVHCLDILHALTKNVLGDVEENEEFQALQEQMNDRFQKSFPSRTEVAVTSSTKGRKRQEYAARVIQRAYKNYKNRMYRIGSGSNRTSITNSPLTYLKDLSQQILSLPRRLSITRSITRSSSRLSVRSNRSRAGSVGTEIGELKPSNSFESASSCCSSPVIRLEPNFPSLNVSPVKSSKNSRSYSHAFPCDKNVCQIRNDTDVKSSSPRLEIPIDKKGNVLTINVSSPSPQASDDEYEIPYHQLESPTKSDDEDAQNTSMCTGTSDPRQIGSNNFNRNNSPSSCTSNPLMEKHISSYADYYGGKSNVSDEYGSVIWHDSHDSNDKVPQSIYVSQHQPHQFPVSPGNKFEKKHSDKLCPLYTDDSDDFIPKSQYFIPPESQNREGDIYVNRQCNLFHTTCFDIPEEDQLPGKHLRSNSSKGTNEKTAEHEFLPKKHHKRSRSLYSRVPDRTKSGSRHYHRSVSPGSEMFDDAMCSETQTESLPRLTCSYPLESHASHVSSQSLHSGAADGKKFPRRRLPSIPFSLESRRKSDEIVHQSRNKQKYCDISEEAVPSTSYNLSRDRFSSGRKLPVAGSKMARRNSMGLSSINPRRYTEQSKLFSSSSGSLDRLMLESDTHYDVMSAKNLPSTICMTKGKI